MSIDEKILILYSLAHNRLRMTNKLSWNTMYFHFHGEDIHLNTNNVDYCIVISEWFLALYWHIYYYLIGLILIAHCESRNTHTK